MGNKVVAIGAGSWVRRLLRLAVVALGLLVSTLLLANMGYACPIQKILGRPCPTCGLTRGAVAFLQGDFSGAWESNPLLYPVVGILVMMGWDYLRGCLTHKRLWGYALIYGVVALGFWLI